MADEHAVVSLLCPKCAHYGARPYIGSATVLTIKCVGCNHSWSLDTNILAPDLLEQVNAAMVTTPK